MTDWLTPDLLLRAYSVGLFPMAESRESGDVFWVDPDERGIIPLNGFHISRTLRKTIRQEPYKVSFNRDFAAVVLGCADRSETWINDTIFELCVELHAMGHAHSVELWDDQALVGGVYGLSLGGAFFGESMFSRRTDASKIALAYLVDRLRQAGFLLFDTQFQTPHLQSLGAVEISRDDYMAQLSVAQKVPADFNAPGEAPSAQLVLQRSIQTS